MPFRSVSTEEMQKLFERVDRLEATPTSQRQFEELHAHAFDLLKRFGKSPFFSFSRTLQGQHQGQPVSMSYQRKKDQDFLSILLGKGGEKLKVMLVRKRGHLSKPRFDRMDPADALADLGRAISIVKGMHLHEPQMLTIEREGRVASHVF